LKTGSPAIDAGDPNFTPPPNYDQRGVSFARVVNSRIDIGAFERQASDIDPTLVVTKTADTNDGTCDSDCSLREAITAANTSAPDDVIYFAVTGTITLNSLGTLPALNSNMKILGPGANALAVQRDPAAANFRIFTVNSGKTDTISGLTIRNGADNFGGGGIYNDHAILTVTNSTISGNSGDSVGGGIYSDANGGSATLTVTNSTISGNSASGMGGGIISDASNSGSATLTITNSTISGNSAGGNSAGFGGGHLQRRPLIHQRDTDGHQQHPERQLRHLRRRHLQHRRRDARDRWHNSQKHGHFRCQHF
jgi:CSLREA domain-containing protein